MIDFRSDTVTKPSRAMRTAMARAEVGDDCYGEDPTVRRLEEESAAILGKEAALFVASGTMANQIAIMAATRSGDETWAHERSHVVESEQGGAAVLARVQMRTFSGGEGLLDVSELQRWLKDPADVHYARPRLIFVENTISCTGGTVLPQSHMRELCEFTRENMMAIHLDGARLWNAAVATGVSPRALAVNADTVSVSFSKGLGAPVGSALAGDQALISEARRLRKLLGGGMRQAGIIAGGALYALHHNISRLEEDHMHAKLLAEGLADLRGIRVDPNVVETNMVLGKVAVATADTRVHELSRVGVACLAVDRETIRFVTHLDLTGSDIERAIKRVREIL